MIKCSNESCTLWSECERAILGVGGARMQFRPKRDNCFIPAIKQTEIKPKPLSLDEEIVLRQGHCKNCR